LISTTIFIVILFEQGFSQKKKHKLCAFLLSKQKTTGAALHSEEKNKQRSDTTCLLRFTRCITQAVASNRRTPKTSFRVLAHKLFLPK
ncbi:MAG: hypothetical protein SPF28_01475, partial [Eubacteriales bacterium]|nr:hypothetical protein [Eubacteriales bacterium]